MALRREGLIRVGTAGWSYPDWEGLVYPSPRPRGFDPLRFLSGLFDVIEINSTFYRPAERGMAASWLARVAGNARFVFTAKLWRGFTHDRGEPHHTEEQAWRDGLAPLAEAGKLSCVLVQFPHSFRPAEEGREYLASLIDRFSDYRLVVELRRRDWADAATLEWLSAKGVAFCDVDQPRLGTGGGATLRPTEHVTAPVAYVRLHGRNAPTWFAKDEGRDARYDYLYTPAELEPWVTAFQRMVEKAEELHVIANNHFRGKAVVNALMIRAMLQDEPVKAPAELLAAYPQLQPFALQPPQGSLF